MFPQHMLLLSPTGFEEIKPAGFLLMMVVVMAGIFIMVDYKLFRFFVKRRLACG